MEEFYSGYDDLLKRPVSIYPVAAPIRKNPEALQEYLRLAQNNARLNHPNILATYDVDHLRLVTESTQAGTRLDKYLQVGPNDRRAFTPGFQAQFLPQLLTALNYAHEHGIIHRSLTPECIWLFPHGEVKVWGFGIAFLEVAQTLTAPGQLLAPLYFMAPEQSRGEKSDRRCDIWAVGVLLHLLETGRYPFTGTSLPFLIQQILLEEPPPVNKLITRCLQKDPANRPQTANAMHKTADAIPLEREALLHHILACNYYRQQKYPLAQLEWSKACLVDPHQRVYRNNLGAAHFQNDELDQARECFQESPFNLGLLLYHQQEFQAAREALIRATHLVPKHAAGYYLLGECLLKLNKVWPAIEEFGKSLILNPRGSAALGALGRCYQLLNRLDEAQRYQEQADECGPEPEIQPLIEGSDWTQATL